MEDEIFKSLDVELVFRLVLATALGSLIGFERESKNRPAGLRTHMLVSLGSALFSMISISFEEDPTRIAAGIVAGIGFLGAGSIISSRQKVRGLTTAATLWIVAAIGLSIGTGFYVIGVVSAVIVFLILQLGHVEKRDYTEKDEEERTDGL
ncbi:MgtC/SapB family protein [Nitrosopumilus sp.]|uniref:MgtC/SapB family protein n=1 Tax=Nitrosopumilus sp. TaxID=2024843 RepID=UPI003B58EBBF